MGDDVNAGDTAATGDTAIFDTVDTDNFDTRLLSSDKTPS